MFYIMDFVDFIKKVLYSFRSLFFQEEQGVLLLNPFHFMKRFHIELPYWKQRSVRIDFSFLYKRFVKRKR